MIVEQVLQTFLTESEDLMREIEAQLLKLESEIDDTEAINALFRAIHTLKGSSGMVGITNIEQFLHWVESVMEKVRTGVLIFNEDLADILLKAYDHLGVLVDRIDVDGAETKDPEIIKQEEFIVLQLQGYLSEFKQNAEEMESAVDKESETGSAESPPDLVPWQVSLKFKENTFRFGFDPTAFIMHMSQMGEITGLKTLIEEFPPADQMDPESCYLSLEIDYLSAFEKKDIEDIFEFLGDDVDIKIIPSPPKVQSYVSKLDKIAETSDEPPDTSHRIGELLVDSGAVTEKELDTALKKQQSDEVENGDEAETSKLGELLVADKTVDVQVLDRALEVQKPIKAKREKVSKTIRIETDKLDQFIDLVGELVISSAGIMQQSEDLRNKALMEVAAMNSRLVGEMRERIMELRMVPIQETFNRFQRVIREISKESGKQIRLEMEGGDAELDKTVIERIFDPLMHLVRNAADHGIEMPEVRTKKGKLAEGTILLKAYHDSGMVVIEIKDDGAGINQKAVLDKAIANGVITEKDHLKDKDILNLIFTPGFSTAEKVTKLSGRGVGMDVVKSNIEALRGTVELESEEGSGSTVRISLPLTMAIIEGLLIGVGDSKYVIPLEMVVECIDLPEDAMNRSHHYVNLRGKPLPFLWLREIFEETGPQSEEQSIVVIKLGNKTAGLVTDMLYGEIQAVIKNLDEVYKNVPGISGATILGDGRVSLILDVKGLIELAEGEYLKNISQQPDQVELETESAESIS
ncbi:MAG: chemotaxis protein CheA [Proteobacteria bacterium]|nr:chemotaxis protein CheA [Pseudomonadota bacterium]